MLLVRYARAMQRLASIGYWSNDFAPSRYPDPRALVGRWLPARRAAVVAYLRRGALFERYQASSYCRFACGVTMRAMGQRDLFDGVFIWPEGLAHYVAVHAVRLPERFIRHALRRTDAPMPVRPQRREGLIDDATWIAWGLRRR